MSGESIYTWIKETPPPPPKAPMYHSKHDPTLPPYVASSTFREAAVKKPVGTIGRTVKEAVRPTTYLKAHEKTGIVEPVTIPPKFDRTAVEAAHDRKPAVPRRTDAPLHGLTSGKDFVTSNAVDAMLAVPKKPVGIKDTEAETNWLARPEYGKVPEYLSRVKADIEAEHDYIMSLLDEKAMAEEAASGIRTRELTSGEREDLIEGLKSKWDEVNKAYQRITFKKISTSNSTTGEIRFKEQCETALASIERDIARLSVKAPIYVVDDSHVVHGAAAGGGATAAAAAAPGGGSRTVSASSLAGGITGGAGTGAHRAAGGRAASASSSSAASVGKLSSSMGSMALSRR